MKNWIKRDRKARLAYAPVELKKFVLQSLLANKNFPWTWKYYWSHLFHRQGLTKRFSFFRHGCHISYGGRSVFRFFKLSRHWSKHFSSLGVMVGMRKSSF
jgi:ribosomal protein S14